MRSVKVDMSNFQLDSRSLPGEYEGVGVTRQELLYMSTDANIVRNVSIFYSNKNECLELRRVEVGGYTEDEVPEMLDTIIEDGRAVSNWMVWDATSKPVATRAGKVERRTEPYTSAEFKRLVTKQSVALVWCKRGAFRAPVLKVGDVRTTAEKKAKTSTRIGK